MIVRRIGSGAVSEVMAERTAQTLMQSDVMSLIFVMAPMRAIPVLNFVLCKSCTSSPSLLRELRSTSLWSVAPQQVSSSVEGETLMGPRRWLRCGHL